MSIRPNEILLVGKWIKQGGKVVADKTASRVLDLASNHLHRLGRDSGGWDALLVDPDDGRLWELIYPQGEMQGGGPPTLRWLSKEEAIEKYGDAARQAVE